MIEIHMSFNNGAEARQELTEFAELIMSGAAPNFAQIDSKGTTKPLPDVIECGAASTSPVIKTAQYAGNGAAQASKSLPQKTVPAPSQPAPPQKIAPNVTAVPTPQVAYADAPKPQQPQTPPVAVQPTVPAPQPSPAAAAHAISRAALNIAITKWTSSQTDGANFAKLRGLLAKYQINTLPLLREEDIPAFAADAKALGVQF